MPNEKRSRQKEREQQARAARAAERRARQRRRSFITFGLLIVGVFAFAVIYSIVAGGNDTDDDDAAAPPPSGSAECPPEDSSAERRIDFDGPPPDCLVQGASYEAVFETDVGEIRVQLDTERTPETTNNFVFLARYGYYDGTEMFRSNTDIDIIQGGAPRTNDGSDPGPGYTIQDEGGPFSYEPGQLVMARTAAPNSASAQYFFSTGPGTAALDAQGTYVVFGTVVDDGLEVLEAIMATHEGSSTNPAEGAPDPKPVVNSVRIVQS